MKPKYRANACTVKSDEIDNMQPLATADEKLRALTDPYFRANPPSSELVDLIVEAVPGADRSVAAKDDYKREQRAAMHSEQLATGGRR